MLQSCKTTVKKKSVPSFFSVNWEKVSLRSRCSKGKGKGIRARDRARWRREEGGGRRGCHFIISLVPPTRSRAPKFPLPLLTPATQARKKCVTRAKFFFANQTYLIFWLFSLPSLVGVTRFYILFSKLQILTRALLLPLAKSIYQIQHRVGVRRWRVIITKLFDRIQSTWLANDSGKSKAGRNSGANTMCINKNRTSSFCFSCLFHCVGKS